MKRLFGLCGLLLGLVAFAYAQSATEVADTVAKELQTSGVITSQEQGFIKSSVKTLMETGVGANEAKTIVSQAARQAKSQGLKGKALAAKVQEAVRVRKAQMEEAKKKAKETAEQAKEEARRKEKETRKRLEKESRKAKGQVEKVGRDLNKKWSR